MLSFKVDDVEDLGNNNWLVIIEGEVYQIHAPNIETAKSRALAKHM